MASGTMETEKMDKVSATIATASRTWGGVVGDGVGDVGDVVEGAVGDGVRDVDEGDVEDGVGDVGDGVVANRVQGDGKGREQYHE